ncbi:P-loop containing nucleoside triphosphate hydrolase protein [Peziza echinospora]|nr:P-loop containing nucleoside triphosphate hydrolase protein [Peziza echinospora]
MAPSKRPRTGTDVAGRSSSSLQNGSKRQKANNKQPRAVERDSESATPEPPARVEVEEDDSEEDEEALEASTQRARKAIEEKNSQFATNAPADFGIVIEIELENFMCHDHLIVPFGPLINFVIGHNGSGKSAILTALTLCLGGKAASTNRGSSLKAFIKEGRPSSRITVKLKNGGDGYKPEQYGSSIYIERIFSRDGSSGYRLKNSEKKLVSSKKEELDEICDYMGIQVDNPMNILTQDAARQFINNSSDKEKYKFFVKGVQLEQLDMDYKLLIDLIQKVEMALESHKGLLAGLKTKLEEAKKKVLLCKGQADIRNKITHINNQIAWVQVESEEKKLEEARQDLLAIEDKISRLQEKIRAADRKLETTSAQVELATNALAEEKDKSRPLIDEHRQLKDTFDTDRIELTDILHQQRQAKSEVDATERQIKAIMHSIEAEKQRIASIGSTAALYERKEETAKMRHETIEQLKGIDLEKEEERQKIANTTDQLSEISRKVDSKQREIEVAHSKIQELHSSQKQYMSVFGDKMPNLIRAIEDSERKGEWREKPIGPIGQHIRLIRNDWSSILESVLGNQLRGFIVTNHDDKTLLMNLMKRSHFDCPVYVCKNTPLNPQRPDPQYTTILDVLEISSPLVTKQLIITSSIEQSLLFEDQDEANQVWGTVNEYNRNHINIKVCYAKNQGRRNWGLRIGGGKVGGNNVRPVKPGNGAPKMRTDLESQLRQVQSEISQLAAELDELKAKRAAKQQALTALQNGLKSFETKRSQLKIALQRLDVKLEQINMDISDNSTDDKLIALESNLETGREALASQQNTYQDLSNRRNILFEAQANMKRQIDEFQRQIYDMQDLVKKREMELHAAQAGRQQALVDLNHWHNKLEQEQGVLQIQQGKVTAQSDVVRDYNEQASGICARIVLDRGTTKEKLIRSRDRLNVELQEAEKQIGGTRNEILAAYNLAKENYGRSKFQLKKMDELSETMTQSYNDRIYRWKKFRHYISARARAQFMWLMSTRSYRGRLRIDYEAKTLSPEVQTNQRDSGGGRGPKTLSGGEKSFSTVCLLLALWEAMGSPIRCLDEFDVFMDPVNRTVSVNLMISGARRSIGKQFILITPQDMSAIEKSHDVKVTRLDDPKRNGQLSITGMMQQ